MSDLYFQWSNSIILKKKKLKYEDFVLDFITFRCNQTSQYSPCKYSDYRTENSCDMRALASWLQYPLVARH